MTSEVIGELSYFGLSVWNECSIRKASHNVSRRPFSPDSRADRHQLEVSWRVEIHINTMDGRFGGQKSPTKGLKYALYVITQVPLEKGVGLSGNLTYVFVTMAKAAAAARI